jgi:hypothetical protein
MVLELLELEDTAATAHARTHNTTHKHSTMSNQRVTDQTKQANKKNPQQANTTLHTAGSNTSLHHKHTIKQWKGSKTK